MSRIYGEAHRLWQERLDSRRLADRIEEIAVRTGFGPDEKAFIEARDMFFLSSTDHRGRPTVSYKGGDPGLVRVLDPVTLAFPLYDGNGMQYSLGNISQNGEVGLLFIDFVRPHRIRVQGRASVSLDDPIAEIWPEAEVVVRVTLSELWQNCPRYVHRYEPVKRSRYVPRAGRETPLCEWKRIDAMQDVLRPLERERAAESGHITAEEWMARVMSGDENA
jgi:predicted pyridoxine 5'-phosphate oxidase superfamily flavin-nucleotide-binding protein